ncbi:hypothetical protein CDD80_5861 [Ophiocordyceps camponoti-rufipedis]|uniref:Uncharacterized protein n=1 Tax=Ophiocordyceps camponoti-rufipedis TaxID=2004952 RepID=A0A2C5YLQ1_9HYPO|nr:hypothetical protein CDD80_5861 [Ophiocordyceps camponoti-rufipedis]
MLYPSSIQPQPDAPAELMPHDLEMQTHPQRNSSSKTITPSAITQPLSDTSPLHASPLRVRIYPQQVSPRRASRVSPRDDGGDGGGDDHDVRPLSSRGLRERLRSRRAVLRRGVFWGRISSGRAS